MGASWSQERLSCDTVFRLGRKCYLATWASSVCTWPLKMLSLWGILTRIIFFFFCEFPNGFAFLFWLHPHPWHLLFECQPLMFSRAECKQDFMHYWKIFTVDRLHWNKPPFELVLLYCLVDEKLRSGNSILRLNLSFYWSNKTTDITVFGHSSTCWFMFMCLSDI